MINCRFKKHNNLLIGFTMSGHAGYAESGQDIICAAVTSATDLTIHLCEEYFNIQCSLLIAKDGHIEFKALSELDSAHKLISGLYDYLKSVQKDYPKSISIKFLEV